MLIEKGGYYISSFLVNLNSGLCCWSYINGKCLQALNGNLFVCLIICATGDNMKVHTQVSPLIEGKANGKATGVHESAPAPANLVGMSIEFPNKNIETGVVSVGSFAGAGSTFRGLVQVRKYLHLRAEKYMSINMCLNKMKHNFFIFILIRHSY
jgi:hypothetical protein